MELAKTVGLLIIGFVLLIRSSNVFVDAISSIAVNFKMSKMMIALTIAAFGTCAPELAISFNSITSGQGDIALANVVGSNIVNIILIIGLAAITAPIKVRNTNIKKELPILLAITTTFTIALTAHFLNNTAFVLDRGDGLLFLLFFLVFIIYILSVIKIKPRTKEKEKPKYNLTWSIILTIICCVVIIFASDLVVNNAKTLATMAGVSTKIITMTIVVIGTSLPEMTMTVIAAKKQEFDIALGNIIGTNIFNIGVVLGLPLLIFDGFSAPNFNLIDILVVQIAAFVLYFFAKNDKRISKKEGIVMIFIFVLYYLYVLFQ